MPNHPTVPVLEGVKPASIKGVDCEKLKVEFDIDIGPHGENYKWVDYQSHHILQDAATDTIIHRDDAMAVMLLDSHGGTEHCTITSRQNERMRNKKNGITPGPAKTLGELKKQAKGDLMAGLEQRRLQNNKSKKKLEQLADCLVAEAEKELQDAHKEQYGKKMKDGEEVEQPGECLSADTIVWLENEERILSANLTSGLQIETADGPMPIIRTDQCRSDLLEVEVLGSRVALAPFHRVLTAYGYSTRADHLKPGHEVLTMKGKATITEIHPNKELVTVYNFGVGRQTACKIGSVGLWVDVPDTGPPVIRSETIFPYSVKEIVQHGKNKEEKENTAT